MHSNTEGQILHDLFSAAAPDDRPVRWWIDDQQGGGSIEYITKEEESAREAVLADYRRTGVSPDPLPMWW